ncbi:Rad4-domain-containing protein [Paraphaeosphaeria sporulosa]|uniref:Rad4-domain-containing protein n=1 Tax=Paraphaeosphaeria sporulosa TaxID=1460663 RepID=A0A177CAP5_9PLEO|nr:Rad4-domain-containing protein [Paraphaeosphaeria sporulosa]OAG03848.1 Rad4-domain-containing protein [Paraphaeosphaeria sporulosa]
MPPSIPRKRLRSDSPKPRPPPKRTAAHPRRTAPSSDTPPTVPRTLSQKKKQLELFIGGGDDSELSSAESSEDEFEEVPLASTKAQSETSDGDESEDEEWEDALGAKHHTKHDVDAEREPVISGDLSMTIDAPRAVEHASYSSKKGPSKRDRQVRTATHCMHVQFLMFHNLIRNAWICDPEVQRIMLAHLNAGCWKAVNRYWRDAGISDGPERVVKGGWTDKVAAGIGKTGAWIPSGTKGVHVYESPQKGPKGKAGKAKPAARAGSSKDKAKKAGSDRNARDWGATSERLEPNTPNLSAGDPLPRLLNYLAMYWKGKYKITAPSLRKRGYLSLANLRSETEAWKDHKGDANTFGERVENLAAYRELARGCEGSRDVGQQLFTSLVRALGVEARMVASLQPVGFRFNKAEEGKPKDLSKLGKDTNNVETNDSKPTPKKAGSLRANGAKDNPIDLSDSELSSAISVASGDEEEPGSKDPENAPAWQDRFYGRVIPYPTYWTEAISHLTHTPVAISVLPKITVATPADGKYYLFESTPANAERGHQVFAYLIAFSSDGSAKDVTTRYLRNRRWPGVTKGFRMPVEKIAIHNKKGKVKRWEEWNWFKSVLRPYARPHSKRQPWDEVEDEGDLVPPKPVKPKTMDEGAKETLQGYKNSAKYVLERHLRREEALKPDAPIIRYFTTGKGDNEKQEPVYRREDVVTCKSVESWHKEGREVKVGEQPLKFVPMRAVTVQRKREIEERERTEGQKVEQGLYSEAQTDWIIPDPIVDGKIPRNAFGNIDVYVPTMVPRGAIHIPLKGTVRICKKLKIDYAEACTGFEFGKQRAVPVITGVVVAIENEDLVIDAWEAAEADKAEKEEAKREKHVLGLWKKFVIGLRIVERVNRHHGQDAVEVWQREKDKEAKKSAQPKEQSEWDAFHNYEGDFEGGFMREEPNAAGGFMPANDVVPEREENTAGGFMVSDEDDAQPPISSFHVEGEEIGQDHEEANPTAADTAYQTPISMQSLHQNPALEQRTEVLDGELSDSEGEPLIPASSNRTRGTLPSRGRGRGRGRGAKRASTSTRNSIIRKPSVELEDNSSLSEPLTDDPASVADHSPNAEPSDPEPLGNEPEAISPAPKSTRGKRKASAASPVEGRSVPKRKAARKSTAQVKSHFFAGSDEETDATDITDRSPQKAATRGRARGRGRRKA